MRLHPRTAVVEQARCELTRSLIDIETRHGLTMVETIKILNESQASLIKYAIRAERHPNDPDKRGDEE